MFLRGILFLFTIFHFHFIFDICFIYSKVQLFCPWSFYLNKSKQYKIKLIYLKGQCYSSAWMIAKTKETISKTNKSLSNDNNQNYGVIVGIPLGIVIVLVFIVACFIFIRYILLSSFIFSLNFFFLMKVWINFEYWFFLNVYHNYYQFSISKFDPISSTGTWSIWLTQH